MSDYTPARVVDDRIMRSDTISSPGTRDGKETKSLDSCSVRII